MSAAADQMMVLRVQLSCGQTGNRGAWSFEGFGEGDAEGERAHERGDPLARFGASPYAQSDSGGEAEARPRSHLGGRTGRAGRGGGRG